MCRRSSLTLRVKVLGIEGLRSIPLDLEVSWRDPLGDKNPSRGVTEGRWWPSDGS